MGGGGGGRGVTEGVGGVVNRLLVLIVLKTFLGQILVE